MKLEYKLNNTDFLEYHLFTSSKSELHKKKRMRLRFIVPILYILIGLYLYVQFGATSGAVISIAFAILWFLFYPRYSKWRYKKHFEGHIKENYKNRIDQIIEIKLNADSIYAKDYTSESKIRASELKSLIEIKDHFFIKLTTDLSFIIPKRAISDQLEFKRKISDFSVEYLDELNWKWK